MAIELLSELEGIALGIVHHQQPCTPYAVRRELKSSPSTHWRASAGSIYPLLERLEKLELVNATSDRSDGRRRRLLSTTRSGKAALRRFIRSGLEQEVVAGVFDPIRSRAFFIDLLPPRERHKFLRDAHARLEHYLETTREHLGEKAGDTTDYFASLGAVYEAEARVRWMAEWLRKEST